MGKPLFIIKHIPFHELEQYYKQEKNARVKTKILAVIQLYLGKSTFETAFHVHSSPQSVRKWIHQWNKDGMKGLQPIKRAKVYSLLSEEQEKQIKKDIKQSPRKQGYSFSNWHLKDIKGHIKKKYDIDMSISGVWRMMKRWDYTLLVPRPMPAKADEKKKINFDTK
ncbi:MAG: winged helix-turn-helix domain-containing protein [Candidatus Lokiarchaeota archaeon]|nr:winged helix-turn-helix domain-containing protein [Candidatus Harpocratesius repetitus]